MSGLIDWGAAERIARLAAGAGNGSGSSGPDRDLDEVVAEAVRAVTDYTRLEPREPLPDPSWVSREQWVALNLESLRIGLTALEERLDADRALSGPVGGGIRAAVGLLAGAQLGAVVGYASRRVLGQYEYPVLGPDREPRLLFIAANLEGAGADLHGEPDTVLRWIALHEVTHAVHLGSAPWMRGQLRGLATQLLEESSLRLDLSDLGRRALRIPGTDPRELLAELRASDPLSLLAPADSRELLERTQATMAAIEGFAEHVMDAAAPGLGEDVGALRAALERRRANRSPLARLLAWLLGLELKLRQYRDGKRFCDAVVDREGIERLNGAWRDPEALPTIDELRRPERWLARTAPARV